MTDIKELLALMVERGASDLFISAEVPPYMKIGGITEPAYLSAYSRQADDNDLPLAQTPWPALVPRESKQIADELMNAQQREEFEATKECNFALVSDRSRRYRINAYYQRGEVSLAIRLIGSRIPTFGNSACRLRRRNWLC